MSSHTLEITDVPTGLLDRAFPGLEELRIDRDTIGFVPQLGFLALKSDPSSGENTNGIDFLGIYTGSEPFKDGNFPERFTVPHKLEQIDPAYRTADRVGKGILGRLWNNSKAARGWIDDPHRQGIYTYHVNNPANIYMETPPFGRGSSFDRVLEHANIRDIASAGALSDIYSQKRHSYGASNEAFFMTEPPLPRFRRYWRFAFPVPKSMFASFLGPLTEDAEMVLVGTARRR